MVTRSEKERELAKKVQRLRKNITRRFQNIQRAFGRSRAMEKYYELEIPLTTRGLSGKELKKMYDNLLYISSLKTSYVRGAKNFKIHFEDIMNTINFDKKLEDRFWSLYDKITEENLWLENYKYEIFDTVNEYINEGLSDEDIIKTINKTYQEVYEKENSRRDVDNPIVIKHRKHRNR